MKVARSFLGARGRKQRASVGVELDASHLRIVALAGGRLHQWTQAPIPSGTIQRGVIRDPIAVGTALRRAVEGAGLSGSAVHTAVSGAACVVRRLNLPAPSAVDLRRIVRWEAERLLPYPILDSIVDFDVLSLSNGGAGNRADLLLVGVRAEVVQGYVDALRAAGLEPAGLDVVPLARARACRAYVSPPGVLLVGMSADAIELTAVNDRGLVFTRNIPTEPGADSAAEVYRSLRFFETQFDARPACIVMTGEEAPEPFMQRLRATEGIPVVDANPLANIDQDDLKISAVRSLCVAVGLALRGLDSNEAESRR